MKLKADWLKHLHRTRAREIALIFNKCPEKIFKTMLEIGAGDGFQSALLLTYTQKLVCTEYDEQKLQNKISDPAVSYKIVDAENLPHYFKPKTFDVIFSSNVFEHLHQPEKVFKDMHAILANDGVCVHIMPSPFLKWTWLLLFYPNQVITLLEMLTQKGGAKSLRQVSKGDEVALKELRADLGNNPKAAQRSWLKSQLWPTPHGAYPSHIAELRGYSRKRWTKVMHDAGFTVIAVKKMPVSSGYGFGADPVRKVLEKAGATSSYCYIAVKKGTKSPYRKYFV